MNTALEEVIGQIENKKSFLLEAGAGSGKTRTLVESLQHIIETKSNQLLKNNKLIACITYTNVAKDEIRERIDNNPLVLVLTIHEFLWHVIKNYQKELRKEILDYNNNESVKPIDNLEKLLLNQSIEYSQYGRKFEKGRITHEDILNFSSKLFDKYPKISTIVANKFPFVFIDEYQDTEERTVKLLLDKLLKNNLKQIVLGFFGDSMQKIYNQGVGEINNELLTLISKKDNYRCSKEVIKLLNKIRPQLIQNAAGVNLQGSIVFFNCNSNLQDNSNYNRVLNYLQNTKGWDFEVEKTKILFLTHKGIASKLGYESILRVYGILPFGRDRLFNRDEIFAKFLHEKVEKFNELFEQKKYGEFISLLGISDFKINKHSDKEIISDLMIRLNNIRKDGTVKDVLEFVFDNNLLTKPSRIEEFLGKIDDEDNETNKEFYNALMGVKYSEITTLYNYIEESTPFSTKHGVKGAEFDNVLVVIDDRAWNQYKFNDVFAVNNSNQSRYNRTRNLLYVCCSRAKDNLAVLSLSEMDVTAMSTINDWFQGNVFEVSKIPS